MSLQSFLVDNRQELIQRTRAKVAARSSPPPSASEMEHGVPIFLTQLVAALDAECKRDLEHKPPDPPKKGANDIEKSAALHGKDLRKFGFTIEQVVHDYGDVCQAVTELAVEQEAKLTNGEFHTLNRCLDNAIAGAVTSWNKEEENILRGPSSKDGAFLQALGTLLNTATVSFDVLQAGTVGMGGATGTLLQRCLVQMRELVDQSVARPGERDSRPKG